jgi:hypothetical protein
LRIKQNVDKLCYIENVIKENPAYFENFPPERLRRLHAGAKLYTFYIGLAISVLSIRGVEPNSGKLIGHVAPMQSAQASLPFLRAAFAERLAAYRREEAGAGADPQGGA